MSSTRRRGAGRSGRIPTSSTSTSSPRAAISRPLSSRSSSVKRFARASGRCATRKSCADGAPKARHPSRLVSDLAFANRQLPSRPHEVAGVAAGISQQVILVLGLGFPELARRHDFGRRLAGPEARLVDVGNRVFGYALLLGAGVEDRRSIARPYVVPLAIARAGVVDLEEELEDLPIAHHRRVEDDLDRLGMSAMIAIGSVRSSAARVANPGRHNAVVAAQELLHTPEAAAGKRSEEHTSELQSLRHLVCRLLLEKKKKNT